MALHRVTLSRFQHRALAAKADRLASAVMAKVRELPATADRQRAVRLPLQSTVGK